jgi:hypothetical protein
MSAQDQIIDAVMALALQADAIRTHPLMAWIVMQDNPTGAGAFVARLVTDAATLYVSLADTLARLRDQLPPGLTWTDRQLGFLSCGGTNCRRRIPPAYCVPPERGRCGAISWPRRIR